MGGSGQEIWMGKQSMLNTAYDLQAYEGSDRDDDDNDDVPTVYDGGDGNFNGRDDNDDDNDQQVEGNEYSVVAEGEDEDIDADEGNEYYDDDGNGGDDYTESFAHDDSEKLDAEDVDVDNHRCKEEEYDDGDFINLKGNDNRYEEEEVIHKEGEEYVDDIENDEDDRYIDATADDHGDNEANGDDADNEQRSGY